LQFSVALLIHDRRSLGDAKFPQVWPQTKEFTPDAYKNQDYSINIDWLIFCQELSKLAAPANVKNPPAAEMVRD
jgi:hypothetical protein